MTVTNDIRAWIRLNKPSKHSLFFFSKAFPDCVYLEEFNIK